MNLTLKRILIIFGVSLVLSLAVVFIQSKNNQGTTAGTEETATQQSAGQETKIENIVSVPESIEKDRTETFFEYETEYFAVKFSTRGASVASLKMKNYTDSNGDYVDLIFRNSEEKNAFLMYWGSDFSEPVLDVYDYRIENNKVIFSNRYRTESGKEFTVVKTYEFRNEDYLFKVSVDIPEDVVSAGDYAYTLAFEPQVGPAFSGKSGDSRYEYRRGYLGMYQKGKVKRKPIILRDGSFFTVRDSKWISVTGKYFTVIAVPADEQPAYRYYYIKANTTAGQTDSLYISVPQNDAGGKKDFYFYCGPQLKSYLNKYYSGADNEWGLRNLNLEDAMESGSFLSWLENIFKWVLQLIYRIIPNYGVAIIILTVLIKLLTWPIQKKGLESSRKISFLSPKVEEIKAKYPNNPQKQNAEIQKVYQENGISPLSGCTPLLIQFLQFPILIAFYGLLNRHFELRGASFIPGWINDLSVPETVAVLPVNLPLLGNQIHILPFLYVLTTVLTIMYSQKLNPVNTKQPGMWFMTWGLPVVFLFILYSAPAGVFVYWITQGLLGALQQYIMSVQKEKKK